jgi:N-acetylglucosamine transport system permease protein
VPVALYGTFVVAAYIQTFQLSLTSWSGLGPIEYIGFDNFVKLWHDDLFWKSVRHNLFLLLLLPLITIGIALVFAFLLNVGGGFSRGVTRGVWGSKFYRVIFFFPQLLALAIVAVIFGRVFAPDKSGLLNGLMPDSFKPWLFPRGRAVGAHLHPLRPGMAGHRILCVLFSAGLGSISQRSTRLLRWDGATRITLFFRITVPLLWSTIQVAWIYLGIAASTRSPWSTS